MAFCFAPLSSSLPRSTHLKGVSNDSAPSAAPSSMAFALCLLPSPSAPLPPPPHPFPIQHGVTLSLCLSPCLLPSLIRPSTGRACSLACLLWSSFTLDWPQSPHDANTCCPFLSSVPLGRASDRERVDGCSRRTDGRTLGFSFRSVL